ncbi:MAG: ABC transporter ATP-binding protein [Candidatus Riflebacteria bacterium]|nr:ABC transporter ATP-binding protein [Candidatus Riflebacteria bacterium]
MSAVVLELNDICKTYPGVVGETEDSLGRKAVLANVNLSLQEGEIYGFVGLNGAGKTTCIKIALGLTNQDKGEVRIFGQPVNSTNIKKIGFSPEKPGFYDFLKGEEVLDFSVRLLGFPVNSEAKKKVLEKTGLWGDRRKMVSAYSKGMQQRLALAAAMLHNPEVYILDEPGSGLDPLGRRNIKEIILDLKRAGKTIFFSTHILADISEICDRIGIIHEGRMVFEGGIQEFNPRGIEPEKRFVEIIEAEMSKSSAILS